jgi:peptidoglycan/xylan/chitin deacetylase (PgdA/CDA1 family)
MYPQGKMKALTLSYDDGVEQDRKLLEILNRYGIKATFNLNSGIQSGANCWNNDGIIIRRLNIQTLPELYAGHEIAGHSLTHPQLETLDEETVSNELGQDKLNLERIFNTQIYGMAYPFGTYNEAVINAVRRSGLRYARGVQCTRSFDIGQELLTFQPTAHHNDASLMELGETFIKLKPATPQIFYLFGHSYEFDIDNNWNLINDFCRLMAGRDDIYYATTAQALLGT